MELGVWMLSEVSQIRFSGGKTEMDFGMLNIYEGSTPMEEREETGFHGRKIQTTVNAWGSLNQPQGELWISPSVPFCHHKPTSLINRHWIWASSGRVRTLGFLLGKVDLEGADCRRIYLLTALPAAGVMALSLNGDGVIHLYVLQIESFPFSLYKGASKTDTWEWGRIVKLGGGEVEAWKTEERCETITEVSDQWMD